MTRRPSSGAGASRTSSRRTSRSRLPRRRRASISASAPAEVERPVRLEDVELRAAADRAAGLARGDLPGGSVRARRSRLRQVVPRRRAGLPRAVRRTRPTSWRTRPTRPRWSAVLAWCEEAGAAAIPFGGGTSVVGGVEPPADRPSVTIDLQGARSRARGRRSVARGAHPGGRDRARAGGAAARARADAAPLPAVVRVLDAGRLDRHAGRRPLRDAPHPHRRLRRVGPRAHAARLVGEPAAARLRRGAEPRPHADRLRGHPRRDHRGMDAGAGRAALQGVGRRSCSTRSRPARGAVRALAQSGLHPSNCRLLDPGEAALTGAAPGGEALLVLGFESADHALGPWMAPRARAVRGPRRDAAASRPAGSGRASARGESEGAWRDAFLQAPYLRDTLVAAGILAETFETAITWDRFDESRRERARARRARRSCGDGRRDLPAHARLPRRRRAVLHGARARAPRLRSSSSGTSSRPPRPRRSWRRAARSPTTTRSAATTGPGTTASARSRSPRRCAPPRRAVDPAGILNPGVLIDPLTAMRGRQARELARADRVLPGPVAAAPAAAVAGRPARQRVRDRRRRRRRARRHRAARAGLDAPARARARPGGPELEHVRLLVCTHAHSDHYGLAGADHRRSRRPSSGCTRTTST